MPPRFMELCSAIKNEDTFKYLKIDHHPYIIRYSLVSKAGTEEFLICLFQVCNGVKSVETAHPTFFLFGESFESFFKIG